MRELFKEKAINKTEVNLEAYRGKVVIKKDPPVAKTEGGILIPEPCQDRPITGTVKSVGKGKYDEYGERIPIDCKPGDRVLFHKWDGLNVTVEGQDFYVIDGDKVLAKLDNALDVLSII